MNGDGDKKLIFIYNADSGWQQAFLDSAHKILSPSTYSCNLCTLTHGITGERREWKEFRKSSPVPMEFLHKDEFASGFPEIRETLALPTVLIQVGSELQTLIPAEKLKQMGSASELIKALNDLVKK